MNDYVYPDKPEHVTNAHVASVYVLLAEYVVFVRQMAEGGQYAEGICSFIVDTELVSTADALIAADAQKELLAAFAGANRNALDHYDDCVPFNSCGNPSRKSYSSEGNVANGRINNPHRRAFINWVCHLVDKPELLP